ncbi:hypothetical protein HKX48_003156, partial [Thoreauomyces humboldtii]
MLHAFFLVIFGASALGAAAAPSGQRSSYGSSSCEKSARSYRDCSKYFSDDKHHICDKRFGHAGTKHGDCITAAAHYHDRCVRSVDEHESFCWSFDYSGGSHGYYSGKSAAKWDEDDWNDRDSNGGGWHDEGYKHSDGYESKDRNKENDSNLGWKKNAAAGPSGKSSESGHSDSDSSKSGHKPSSSSDGSDSCSSARDHFEKMGSPTLKQCVSIACAPGQTDSYISRALYQCDELEKTARRNNHGELPK